MPDLNQTIRLEITRCKVSANQLARESGVSQPNLSAFLRGKDMRGESLGKLCRWLGLELRRKK